ncbi:MAG: tatC2 [Candidatus Adlerbacteria bacterium]|nr:tatC2 [Candidatus Adlerbacteria bacterium]
MDAGSEAKLLNFWEHALALRRYLLGGGLFFIVSATVLLLYGETLLLQYLLRPLNGKTLVFLSPLGPFLFEMKVAFMGAFVVSLPVWLALLSHFVGEALSARKRSLFYAFVAAAGILGLASIALSYRYLVPMSLEALSHFVVPGTTYMLTAESYVSFVLMTMTVSFLVLELPIIIIALSYIRILNPYALARQRRLVFLGILIILAILTPTTDPVMLMLVSVPAMLLTEVGIAFAKKMYN